MNKIESLKPVKANPCVAVNTSQPVHQLPVFLMIFDFWCSTLINLHKNYIWNQNWRFFWEFERKSNSRAHFSELVFARSKSQILTVCDHLPFIIASIKKYNNGETDQPAKARCTLSGIDSCTPRCLQPVPTLGIIFLSFLVWCLVSWSRKGFSPMDTKHSSWSAQLILRPHNLGEWEWSVQGLVEWHRLHEKGTGCFAAFPYFKQLLKLWWPPNRYKELWAVAVG